LNYVLVQMKRPEWLKTRRVTKETWAIDDNGCDMMYLISGKEKSLLIDTGWGIGGLEALTPSLSPLPLIVMNSHGHPDHTFGNGLFREVYIHEADERFVSKPPSRETATWIIENILPKPLPEDFNPDTWATSVPSIEKIRDGHIFELGDRSLQAISVPGHTPGSVCLLDRKARLLFTGDSILAGPIWLHLDESAPLHEFHRNLLRLEEFADEFGYILPAHADLQALPLSKGYIDELVEGIGQVLGGELTGREEKTFAGDGLRCDFRSCGIVYRPDRL